jgi:glycosyltransferase involved in cell wall biosynthesis
MRPLRSRASSRLPPVPEESLRIAWVGGGPGRPQSGGVPGVATELLLGLARRGHRIDCFGAGAPGELPAQLAEHERIVFVWGGSSAWRWNRWYSRTRIAAAVSGLLARALASVRLRRQIVRRHAADPYDLIYQFSSIEGLGVPRRLLRSLPLVLHPETHSAGELKALLEERRVGLHCQPLHAYAAAVATMAARALVQRIRIQRAGLLICISSAFRDHLVRDYRFPAERTLVIPNPVRLERFEGLVRDAQQIPVVLVVGRVAARKGIEDVVAVAGLLHERRARVHLRVIGGPGLWSDYTKLLEQLPAGSSEYVGRVHPSLIPDELARSDVLLQASTYEPFGLTVAEALAAGVPVVATSAVGAIEGVDRSVVAVVAPGDAATMAAALEEMITRARAEPDLAARARAEAKRLFAGDVVCAQVSEALEQLTAKAASERVR